jgi:hypothetical protein
MWRRVVCWVATDASEEHIISSALKMEAICSSETSVVTQRTTPSHIPEDDILHNHRCENLKSYVRFFFFDSKAAASRPLNSM